SSHLDIASHLQERTGLGALAVLVENLDALVDDELPVVGLADLHALERPRRGSLEVDPALVEAAAVAGALELVFRHQPARRAAEMRALGEDRVDALRLAHDPHALVLLELRAHLPDREVGGEAGLEGGRGLEEHARQRGANGGEERDARERAEDRPSEAAEDVAARPEPGEVRLGPRGLLALERLLDAALVRCRRLLLGGCWLSHRNRFLSTSCRAPDVALRSSSQPRMYLGVALRCSSLAPEQRGEHAPYPEHQRDAEQHQPHGGKEQQRRKRQHSQEEAEAERVRGGRIRVRIRRGRRRRFGRFGAIPQELHGVLAKILALLRARRVDHLDDALCEVFNLVVELPLGIRRQLRHAPIVRQMRGFLRCAPPACPRAALRAGDTRRRTTTGWPWRRTVTCIACPAARRSNCAIRSPADDTRSPSTPVTTSSRWSLRAGEPRSTSVTTAPWASGTASTSASSGVRSCAVTPNARAGAPGIASTWEKTAGSTRMGRRKRRASAMASLGRASSVSRSPPERSRSSLAR